MDLKLPGQLEEIAKVLFCRINNKQMRIAKLQKREIKAICNKQFAICNKQYAN